MPKPLEPQTKKQLAARVKYYKEMGIYDFYRRPVKEGVEFTLQPVAETMPIKSQASGAPPVGDKPSALKLIREDIGDCTRCRLHKGRTKLVFGVGNVNADIMFVGEGPGADEDAQGEPFVGRAGQLLNNMISAMGIKREDVYIANIVKCRPPGNRTPEKDECDTCSPFLMRQIEVVKPKAIVALGAVASGRDRKSTRLNSSHTVISYAVFCLKKKKETQSGKTLAACEMDNHEKPANRFDD